MSQVPLSVNQLEAIVETVARDLLEQWAINDRFTEDEIEEAKENAVNDTVFVINEFMNHFNTYMLFEAEKKKL
jgi:hypothetical protein